MIFHSIQQKYLPEDLATVLDKDKVLYEKKKAQLAKEHEDAECLVTVTVTTETTTTTTTKTVKKGGDSDALSPEGVPVSTSTSASSAALSSEVRKTSGSSPIQLPTPSYPPVAPLAESCVPNPATGNLSPISYEVSPIVPPRAQSPKDPPLPFEIAEDENLVYLGLRVYTQNTTARVGGLLYDDIAAMGQASIFGPRPSPSLKT